MAKLRPYRVEFTVKVKVQAMGPDDPNVDTDLFIEAVEARLNHHLSQIEQEDPGISFDLPEYEDMS